MLFFFMFHAPAWVLSCFVRNDTNPSLAMYAMVAGAISNIVLDYLFIFEFGWGIKGGALATGLSQLLIFGILLSHFISGRGVLTLKLRSFGSDQIRSILNIGLPIFFIESTSAVTILIFNYVLLTNYSELHVTAYGIVMNVGLVVLFLMVGIGQACQPIISYNFGADNNERVKKTLFLGLRYSLIVGVSASGFALLGAERIVSLFTEYNQQLIDLASDAMRVYFIAPPLMGLNMMVATLFQAIENPVKATVLSLSRGFIFVVIGLIVLPLFFPENGIWGSVLLAELVAAVMSLVMLNRYLNQRKCLELQPV
jgi:MATE family, multidrug efflux pump